MSYLNTEEERLEAARRWLKAYHLMLEREGIQPIKRREVIDTHDKPFVDEVSQGVLNARAAIVHPEILAENEVWKNREVVKN